MLKNFRRAKSVKYACGEMLHKESMVNSYQTAVFKSEISNV